MNVLEAQGRIKRRRHEARTEANEKKQVVLADLRRRKTNVYIIKKHHLTTWQVRFIIKKEIMRHIRKGTRLELVAHRLNIRLDQIRETRNNYINDKLKKGGSITHIAEKLQMDRQQILAIRNASIERKLVQNTSIKQLARIWQLPEGKIVKIREQAILRRLQTSHPEDVAKAFRLTVDDVLIIRQQKSQPIAPVSHIKRANKEWLDKINQQERAIVASLEQGDTTRAVAKKLDVNQKVVIRTRLRYIEQAFEQKLPIAEISQRFYTPEDELRRLRNNRILYYRDEGIPTEVLARKFNMRITALQRIIYHDGALKQPMKKEKIKRKEPDDVSLPSISADIYAKFMEEIKTGKSMRRIAESLNLDIRKTYAIRNHLLLTKLNNGEKVEDVVKQFNTNATNLYQITFQADLTNYPNVKRRTNSYLTEEQAQKVQEMIKQGKTNSEIANLLSVKKTLVISKRKSLKKKTRLSITRRRITDEQKAAILEEGKYLDIVTNAVKHGVSAESVRIISKRNNELRMKRMNDRKQDCEKLKKMKEIEQVIKHQAKVENIKRMIQEKTQKSQETKVASMQR